LTGLAQTGHSVHYLPLTNSDWQTSKGTIPPEILVEEPLQNSGSVKWLRFPTLVRQLKDRLKRIQPELIHAGPIHQSAALAALSNFHPLVSMSWGSDLLWATRDPRVAFITRRTLARSDAFVGDCQAVKKAAIAYGMNEDRIVIFPWGVDLNHFSPSGSLQIRERLGWENEFILISTRSFEPLYGVDLIIKAFIQLAPNFTNLRLILLGDGSQREVFKSWLDEEGLLARVHFAGVVDRERLPDHYRSANIYISASRSDGSSVSLMEALACGIPALVSDIAGNCEWVEPGLNGWRFNDGDVVSLVRTLRTVLEQPERLRDFGIAARTIAESRANWQDNFPKLLGAYQIALDHVAGKTL
jgi:glycosyltransferase involved in cell wall biosynthesis